MKEEKKVILVSYVEKEDLLSISLEDREEEVLRAASNHFKFFGDSSGLPASVKILSARIFWQSSSRDRMIDGIAAFLEVDRKLVRRRVELAFLVPSLSRLVSLH